jgi:hypothetical protein
MTILQKFKDLLSEEKIAKVKQVASSLSIHPNWLLGVMYFETGRTFNPSKTNSIGSVGLVQFTRDKAGVNYKTINGTRFALEDIGRMSFTEQMDLVHVYLKQIKTAYKVSFNSFFDVYLAVFFPNAIGKSDSYVLETKGLSRSLVARQNPIFDQDKNGTITKGEVLSQFKKLNNSIYNDIKKKV